VKDIVLYRRKKNTTRATLSYKKLNKTARVKKKVPSIHITSEGIAVIERPEMRSWLYRSGQPSHNNFYQLLHVA